MQPITKDMIISTVVRAHPSLQRVFEEYGMGCSYCMASLDETIESGARMHGIQVGSLLEALNRNLALESAAE
jgi:hybrid cluster-associated redox disulfide protein